MEKQQKSFIEAKNKFFFKQNPLYADLRKILLGIGGKEVFLRDEYDLKKIVKEGKEWTQTKRHSRGEPNRCHTNAARLWLRDKKGHISICSGYALARDLWRQHSWGFDGTKIIETTQSKSERYFGIQIKGQVESLKFAIANLPTEEVLTALDSNARIQAILKTVRETEDEADSCGVLKA